jgi:hypothetical protein
MFGVQYHECEKKISKLLSIFSNKYEAHEYLEYVVDNYFKQKEGENVEKKLYKEPSHKYSRRWGTMPFGLIKTRNTDESLYKITIWEKTKESGYIYDSFKITKIMSLDLILVKEYSQVYLAKYDYRTSETGKLIQCEKYDDDDFYKHKKIFRDCIAEYIENKRID